MSHTLYEDESSSVADQITAWEEIQGKATAALSTLRAVADRFQDIEDSGKYKGAKRWASKAAHELATHVDPDFDGDKGFASGVLYLEIDGGGRIYSARPVALDEGFKLFQQPGYSGSLADALRSTTKLAEERLAEHKAKREKCEREASERAALEAASKNADVKPVRILGDVTVVQKTAANVSVS